MSKISKLSSIFGDSYFTTAKTKVLSIPLGEVEIPETLKSEDIYYIYSVSLQEQEEDIHQTEVKRK